MAKNHHHLPLKLWHISKSPKKKSQHKNKNLLKRCKQQFGTFDHSILPVLNGINVRLLLRKLKERLPRHCRIFGAGFTLETKKQNISASAALISTVFCFFLNCLVRTPTLHKLNQVLLEKPLNLCCAYIVFNSQSSIFKAPSQCSYMSLSFVNISHTGYINTAYFPKIDLSMRYDVCLHFVHI